MTEKRPLPTFLNNQLIEETEVDVKLRNFYQNLKTAEDVKPPNLMPAIFELKYSVRMEASFVRGYDKPMP